jgi:oxygen-independent coproporphyrinogen-3 oxidase
LRRVSPYLPHNGFTADTLYIGGGTPSVLRGEDIEKVVNSAKKKFNISDGSEITIECNPASDIEGLIPYFINCGINRVSLGMQSAIDEERRILGRSADRERIRRVIDLLKENGITNISLDVMMGIPNQTEESLKETLQFAIDCEVMHISAYILKIEEGTFFDTHRDRYRFPDEDEVCNLYELCVDLLGQAGYEQYEISNFAKPSYHSRHNTKYWLLEDYLGLGPSAHSFLNNKRYYFKSDIIDFINGELPVFDCDGGDCEEFIMLRLRLKQGLNLPELKEKYGENALDNIIKKAPYFKEQGLIEFDGDRLSLTEKGFLISNHIISELI